MIWMILQILVAVVLAPFFDGLARNIRGKIQGRTSCPVMQTYRDIFKLLKRTRTVSSSANWVLKMAPWAMFAIAAAMVAAVPVAYGVMSEAAFISDILVILYLGAAWRLVWGASSIDSANPFAVIGASRESALALLAEPVMMASLIVVALQTGTTNLVAIKDSVNVGFTGYFVPSFAVAAVAFLWAVFVEMGRKPFDVAEAEQEVQEGVLAEFAGSDLALCDMALMLKQWAAISFFVAIFVPVFSSFSANEMIGASSLNAFMAIVLNAVLVGLFWIGAILVDNFGPRFRLLGSLRFNAAAMLGLGGVALGLYIVGV